MNWIWGQIQQRAFAEAKAMLCKHDMLAYPDFEKPFDLYTDASDLQLAATHVQDGNLLGYIQENLIQLS